MLIASVLETQIYEELRHPAPHFWLGVNQSVNILLKSKRIARHEIKDTNLMYYKIMLKRILAALAFIAYTLVLIKVMVFKSVPMVRAGQVMLNFGGTDSGHAPNFIPFKTILPYLFGFKGLIIAGINLVGNIILLVPLGFLLPFIFPNISWKKSLALAAAAGFIIETLQVVLHVGIFDIDDVILNALGFMIGYWAFTILTKWLREKKYIAIILTILVIFGVGAATYYKVFIDVPPISDVRGEMMNATGERAAQGKDPCGGTGGNGEIVSTSTNAFTMMRKDGKSQVVHFTDAVEIHTSAGAGTQKDLQPGKGITLVGGPNSDGSFAADALFVCGKI
jgi:glycopeptide antibiotics resistance protein